MCVKIYLYCIIYKREKDCLYAFAISGCALLLAVAMVLNDHCKSDGKCGQAVNFGKAEYALLCVGLEGIIIFIVTSFYICKYYG